MNSDFFQQNIMWIAGAAISGGWFAFLTVKKAFARDLLTPAKATLMINREDAIVLDVREKAERANGAIIGSKHIPASQLAGRVAELDKFKERPVIVHCASGMRSSSACTTLRKAGFTKVFHLDGGLGAWEQAGLPLVKK